MGNLMKAVRFMGACDLGLRAVEQELDDGELKDRIGRMITELADIENAARAELGE
jgi:hypothetical protein